MFKDKSKLFLLGALAVLVLTLSNGGFFSHGIGMYGFHGFPKILLIVLVVWMLCGCRGRSCCRSEESCEADSNESEVDESTATDSDSSPDESDKE
ncbi:MAG: hypothetical protein E2O84_00110 [Bacteroidetes bacterium]|nr:MAG: hypothetical protein E2O84_00110 [Bacteroidota bacterium]